MNCNPLSFWWRQAVACAPPKRLKPWRYRACTRACRLNMAERSIAPEWILDLWGFLIYIMICGERYIYIHIYIGGVPKMGVLYSKTIGFNTKSWSNSGWLGWCLILWNQHITFVTRVIIPLVKGHRTIDISGFSSWGITLCDPTWE